MDIGIIIATICGVFSTGISSFLTWLFSKRKYNSEVDNNNIKNMQESLEFYKTLSDDYKTRLEDEIKGHNAEVAELKRESAELRQENLELKRELREQEKKFDDKLAEQQKEITLMKNQMLSVYGQVCLNFRCGERVMTTLPKIRRQSKKFTKKDNKEDK